MAGEIAKAYVQIVPTTEGIKESLSMSLGSSASDAGDEAGRIGGDSMASGIISTLTAAASTIADAAIGAAKVGLEQIGELASYGDDIDKTSQKLGVSSKFLQEWEAVMQHSGTSMSSMTRSFKTLASASQNASDEQLAAFEAIGLSMDEVSSMSQEDLFGAVIAGLQGMEAGTERSYYASKLLGNGATELGALLNTSAEDTQAMIDTVNELGGVMSDDAVKDCAAYQDALQDMQTAFSGVKNGLLVEFVPALSEVMGGITQLVSGDTGGFVTIMSGLEEVGTTIWNTVSGMVETIITEAPEFLAAGMSMIEELVNGIVTNAPQAIENFKGLILQLIESIKNNLPEFLTKGLEIISQLILGFAQNLPSIISSMGEILGSLISAIVEKLPDFLANGVEIIGNLISGLWQALPDILSAIWDLMGDAKDAFFEIDWLGLGKDIIDGVISGITGGVSALGGAIKDAAASALQSAKDFLGIKSPSRVMRDQVGKMISAGIAVGIDAGASDIEDATRRASATITGGIGSVSGTVSLGAVRSSKSDSASNTASIKNAIKGLTIQVDGRTFGKVVEKYA